MLRDTPRSVRRKGQQQDGIVDDIENVPINPNYSVDNLIQNPPNNKFHSDHESKPPKFGDRTPVPVPVPVPVKRTPSFLLRTPERHATVKNRFGFDDHYYAAARNGNVTPRLTARTTTTTSTSTSTNNNNNSETTTSTQTTPTKSVSKPPNPNPGYLYTSSSSSSSSSARNVRVLGFGGSSSQPCVVNTVQVPHFDLKEDPSFWMDHNIQVIIRVRPVNTPERSLYGYNRCLRQESAQTITWIGQPESRFTFDHVACETVDQDMLFRMAGLPMVENCLSGYNSCMFAYGQTGSGKTYTMLGEIDDVEFNPSPHRGMTPRIFNYLFARIRAEEESRRDEKLTYSCKCSFLEIYNEQITDLLDPSSANLLLREDVKKGVYVENLSEFEVHTVGDVLQLLIQGSSNRKVAATNMNRESSRSHCVFTCIIESKWERDSATNLRFARLNLVDLAGSERQKSSGAEGERLKEAANINKSLSTLGHVIMLLVDIAHGKPRHVPYRDSRLTFLLQDSLGGNSKTMIIANVSPSICCAAETLNTLKFAQRAKLIQNNAVVNEDSSGDVTVLQHQIWLLKEELSALKRQNVSRTLAFDSSNSMKGHEDNNRENIYEQDQSKAEDLLDSGSEESLVSIRQLKSLERMLAGALRREQMAETSMKQLEAEIEQLNRLVRQREEDTRCSKMMLKFREDKIQRMESVMGDAKPVDSYLAEENAALSEEIQMLRAKVDRNPEVTRFAVENIRLLEQLRRFQEFYEEGERNLLMNEVSELRAQLIRALDISTQQQIVADISQDVANNCKDNESLQDKLTSTANELAECQSQLKSCLEINSKLSRDIEDLHTQLRNNGIVMHGGSDILKTEMQLPHHLSQAIDGVEEQKSRFDLAHAEEIVNLELELDILKLILKEERSSRINVEELTSSLTRDIQTAEERASLFSKQHEETKAELQDAKSVIAALESQQLLCISEMEELKEHNTHCLELLRKQELHITSLKEHAGVQGSTFASLKHSDCEESPLQEQLKRMQASLDKAKKLNKLYQIDHASQKSNEEEIDEIRQQAEAETAEVIVCLQEELSMLQQRVHESDMREKVSENSLYNLETKLKELQEAFYNVTHENELLRQNIEDKEMQIETMSRDWELLSCEIEEALMEGYDSIRSATEELGVASVSDRRGWISEQVGKMIREMSEKELLVEELNNCLEEANTRTSDLERKLLSLRGAAIVMTESHQQEFNEKERELVQLRSELEACLFAKKEESYRYERNSLDCLQSVEAGVLNLHAIFPEFETQCGSKLSALNLKLDKLEGLAQEAKSSWRETKESLEFELGDAKATTVQKAVEASCLLVRFEEVQEMMKEADIMINGLMIANETMKVEIENLRNAKVSLAHERDSLSGEVLNLQSSNGLLDQKCKKLEEQIELDASTTLHLVEELEDLVSTLRSTSEEAILSLSHDFCCVKSEIKDTVRIMHSLLEEIWSDVLVKHSALSVLILCHVGVLFEVVTGLSAENDSLYQDFHESNTLIHGLREQNMTSTLELDMCLSVRETVLSDMENSFDRISSKEGEIGELKVKLKKFEESFAVLQSQEELMLERSNFIGSELDMLMKEMNQSNGAVAASLAEQEKLLKNNADVIDSQAENLTLELLAKEFEVLYLASEKEQLAHCCAAREKELTNCCSSLDHLMIEIVTVRITADMREQLYLEKEAEVGYLNAAVKKAQEHEDRVFILQQTLEAESKSLRELLTKKESDLEKMHDGLLELKRENDSLKKRFLDKDSEVKLSTSSIDILKLQNCKLQEKISSLESRIALIEKDLETKKAELSDFQQLQSCTAMALSNKNQDMDSYAVNMNVLQEENLLLREELQSSKQRNLVALTTLSSNVEKCADLMEKTDLQSCRMLRQLEQEIFSIHDKVSDDSCQNMSFISKLLEEVECLDHITEEVVSQNSSLQEVLLRKEKVLNGLQFDLQLLQEAAANFKDQKDAIEELEAILESTESDLATKSRELDEAVTYSKTLEDIVKEQGDMISELEVDLENFKESSNRLSDENLMLRSDVEDIMTERSSIERELCEKKSMADNLENDLVKMGTTLAQMNDLVETQKSALNDVTNEKDCLQNELMILEGKLETANALAGENEAIIVEAQQIAESRRIYGEEKDEEVQLLERSVQELDSTISVLENKVDALRGEAERQRLQREELELELHALKNQMKTVGNGDSSMKRSLDEKTRNLQEALTRVKVLEKDLANRDTEIAQCKAHISELTLHAEAQACEYKQKFKELETMVEQVTTEEASNHERIASCNKLEKNHTKGRGSASPFKAKGSSSPFKSRGSGSPFKCIGLGLTHQLKSEKEEEINAEKLRIEELEALSASRQKEIFMLNARLAATESMTHDVIRDLLGVKLDMNNCVNVLDKQQVQMVAEKAQVDTLGCQDQKVDKLKKELTQFIEERQGWLDEIDRRQNEVVAAKIASEKHCQQKQLLITENELLKKECANLKKRVTELEEEVQKSSGQQNFQQRIHHHAKIKEENNMLKLQNEKLAIRLKRAEECLKRVREGIAPFHPDGRRLFNFEEEQKLRTQLEETEKEKRQLAQMLFGLCKSISKAAGLPKPKGEINLSVAQDALDQLQSQILMLERELGDLKVKNRVISERVRIAELKAESSAVNSRLEDKRPTPGRNQAPFFSALDR